VYGETRGRGWWIREGGVWLGECDRAADGGSGRAVGDDVLRVGRIELGV